MKENGSLAKASMVFGIGSIVCSCTCCLGVAAASMALIFGLLSRTEERFEGGARIGIITGIIGLVLSAGAVLLWAALFGNLPMAGR